MIESCNEVFKEKTIRDSPHAKHTEYCTQPQDVDYPIRMKKWRPFLPRAEALDQQLLSLAR